VSLLNGEISVKSEYERETCFILRFSFKIPASDSEEMVIPLTEDLEIPVAWQDYNILLIEDNHPTEMELIQFEKFEKILIAPTLELPFSFLRRMPMNTKKLLLKRLIFHLYE